MATITKPMALDESFNTTESTPRNQADVLAAIESAIRQGFGRSAADVSYDNTTSGLTADDVQEAIDELVEEKVDKVAGKGLSTNDYTDEDKAALDNMELDIESTQSVSGNPITLTDCAPINAESLVVELEPKQDLHGQSAPYVGGAGKNKLPLDLAKIKSSNTVGNWSGNAYYIYGVTFTVNTDDGGNVTGINIDGTLTNDYVDFLFDGDTRKPLNEWGLSIGTTYILSGNRDGAHVIYNGVVANITSGTFTADTSDSYFPCIRITRITYNNVLIQPMVCLATAQNPTVFEKWSNICPITGYIECEVDDVGVNQWDEEWRNGYYDASGSFCTDANYLATQNPIPVKGNKTYYFYCNSGNFGRLVWTDIDGNFISSDVLQNKNFVRISPNNAMYLQFDMVGTYGNVYKHDISINYPSTVTTYQPYHSSNATIQFGQTVYGGKSNFTEGGTSDEFENVDLGDLSWTYRGDGLFSADLSDYAFESDVMAYCSGYRYMGTVDGASMATSNGSVYLYYNDGQSSRVIYVVNTQYTDAIVFKAAVTGIQFVYEKATTTTISTPPTELKLLKGTNNLTTNGTTINLGYQPDNVIGDVKVEIEKCAVDAEFMQFTDGTDTFTDVNLSLDASFHSVSVVGSKIEQKRFICFEVMDKMGGALQGILASCIAFTDGANTPSGTAFRAYIESLQMYVNFRIYGSGGSYTLAYQSETSFSASAFFVRVRMMNNL